MMVSGLVITALVVPPGKVSRALSLRGMVIGGADVCVLSVLSPLGPCSWYSLTNWWNFSISYILFSGLNLTEDAGKLLCVLMA